MVILADRDAGRDISSRLYGSNWAILRLQTSHEARDRFVLLQLTLASPTQ